MRRFRRKSKSKGYDWIVTQGANTIVLLDPVASGTHTLAEFPLITPAEVAEIGEPILVHRVVGEVWLTAPFRSGETNGAALLALGIRVATTDASAILTYLPVDPNTDEGMDASWMFLRSHVLGNIGVPQFQALPLNLFPNLSPGGRHAPQGGPSIDINTKRKMRDTDVLTLSVSVSPLADWVASGIVENYAANDECGIYIHLRALVCASGR